jgi:hypothetical protein
MNNDAAECRRLARDARDPVERIVNECRRAANQGSWSYRIDLIPVADDKEPLAITDALRERGFFVEYTVFPLTRERSITVKWE